MRSPVALGIRGFELACLWAIGQNIVRLVKPTQHRQALCVGAFIILFGTVVATSAAEELNKFRLTVTVIDANGHGIQGAVVRVTHDRIGPDTRAYDYSMGTDTNGVATTMITPNGWGEGVLYWPNLDIAATKGPRTARTSVKVTGTRLTSGVRYQDVAVTLTIAGDEETEWMKVMIAVIVNGDDSKPVPSAAITIKGPGGPYTGRTDANGKASIAVLYISREEYWVGVSKRGYEPKDRLVMVDPSSRSTVEVPITLKKSATPAGIVVTINVKKAGNQDPVRDAHIKIRDMSGVVSEDYYKTTNSVGVAMVRLPGPGTYPISIEQDTFESFQGQIQLNQGDEARTLDFTLNEKGSGETVTITVLAGDIKNGLGSYEPIRGASVTAGPANGVTDGKGRVTLTVKSGTAETDKGAGYAEVVSVTVSAKDYKSKTKSVQLTRPQPNLPGSGAETFTLERGEDQASDKTPIKILVQVHDAVGPVPSAEVELASLGKDKTDSNGERTFDSGNLSSEALAKLRKGIAVKVTHTGHKPYAQTIPAQMLIPSTEVCRYSVELEKDWTELEKELAGLEGRAAALKNEATAAGAKAKSVEAIAAKFPAVKGRVESILAELRKAQQVFDPKAVEKRCQEAAKLVEEIKGAKSETEKKEESLKKTLDQAIGLAANCKTKADAAVIKTKQQDAIKVAGETGVLAKKALEANRKLKNMAETMKDGRTLESQLQQALEKIEGELAAAKKDAASAHSQFNDVFSANRAVPGKRAALVDELNKLKTKFEAQKYDKALPPELKTRLTNLEQLLTSILTPNPPELSRLDEVMTPILAELEKPAGEARSIVTSFKRAICTVQPMDDVVQEIDSRVTGAMIELGAAGDLAGKAAACEAAAASSPSPSPSASPGADEITVPDVSGYDDPGAMKAAAGPNMVGVIMATKASPTPGTTKLFAFQDPPANSKVKRGPPLPTLKIYIYQSLAQATATPSPSPSPSPGADEITVPDVSGFNDPAAMKAAAGPNMAGVIMATKIKPPDGSTKLYAYQEPLANTKVKRGPPLPILKIYIYQSLAQGAISPTPALTGDMPNLIGLTLEQAVAVLPSNMRISSDEIGDKPPTPGEAMTIFFQTPAPGPFDPKKPRPTVVRVKRYGSAQSTVGTGPERFDGTYVGSYSGSDSGTVRFSVNGGTIAITSPGRGTGQISASGAASISGSGADGNSSYTFSGSFSVGAGGKASAGGRWSGQQQGFKGTGTWSAARR